MLIIVYSINDGQFFLRDPVRVVCLADKHRLLQQYYLLIISLALLYYHNYYCYY